MPNDLLLEAHELWRIYDNCDEHIEAVRGVDLAVTSGELVALMGPPGSGKSTLLQLLGGLDNPTRGRVILDGVDLASLAARELAKARNRQVGFVFQAFNLLGNLSVTENVALPAVIAGERPSSYRPRAAQYLKMVGLGTKHARIPSELSGGERQRVAIARALVMDPVVVLADEPTGNLDSRGSDEVLDLLTFGLARRQTVLLVTHDPDVARHADRTLHLRDGRWTWPTSHRRSA